jgi:hypothetical protein
MNLGTHLRLGPMSTVLPSMALDFVTEPVLSSAVTFSRSSAATRVGQNGLIQTVAVDTPRFDYDPVTLSPRGLLIEEQRINQLRYSSAPSNSIWTKVNVTAVDNALTSPDGTANAASISGSSSTSNLKYLVQSYPTTTTGTYTVSVFLKAGTVTTVGVRTNNETAANGARVLVDLSAGTISAVTTTGTCTNSSATITNFGNGWYRVSVTTTYVSALSFVQLNMWIDSFGNSTNTGTYYSYGMQLEAGAFATSYIPTGASTVTRSADIATMTGANFSNWYNASAGTFVASYGASPNQFATYIAASNGVVAQNSVHFDNDSGGDMRAVYYSGSVAQAILSLGAYGAAGTVNKVASAYAVNDFAASRNGGTVVTDVSGALPVSLTQFNIGADPSGAAVNVSNSHIRTIAYYNRRLPNIQLQALSA